MLRPRLAGWGLQGVCCGAAAEALASAVSASALEGLAVVVEVVSLGGLVSERWSLSALRRPLREGKPPCAGGFSGAQCALSWSRGLGLGEPAGALGVGRLAESPEWAVAVCGRHLWEDVARQSVSSCRRAAAAAAASVSRSAGGVATRFASGLLEVLVFCAVAHVELRQARLLRKDMAWRNKH